MSPAGLKAIAEEAGLEMVVVCGRNMGDIFRRNALNLGLHVVQCPEAVDEARDGDEFTFDPGRAALTNETQGRATSRFPSPRRKRRSAGPAASSRSAVANSRRRCATRRASSCPMRNSRGA